MDKLKINVIIEVMKKDAIIIGGGLNGLTMALAMASANMTSIVMDQADAPTHQARNFDGRAYSIAHASQNMLRVLGIWNRVADQAEPIRDIKVSDGVAGKGASPLHVHFRAEDLSEGAMGWMIEDRYLRKALFECVAENENITHLTGHHASDIEVGNHQVSVDGHHSALLIGCDGRQSKVARFAGIDAKGWPYEQASLVCAVQHEKPHNGVAHQLFLPEGPLAILPLVGGYQSAIVWTESKQRAQEIHAMDEGAYLDRLRLVFGEFLGDISLVGDRFIYPLGLQIAQEFVKNRVALVGDAAHGIHPLAGQGLNLGLRDIAALSQEIAYSTRRGEDHGVQTVLDRYQDWRRFEAVLMAGATDSINRVFSNDNPALRGLRDLALGFADGVPGLRRKMVRHAAGLTGRLPNLLQGKSI